jgi:23S rRNA pseudouridine2605 synthase
LKGFRIEPGFAKCERVEVVGQRHLRLVLRQGLKRQIRQMLYHVGEYEVERLVRVRIGPVRVGGVAPGEWRLLSGKEVADLRHSEGGAGKTEPGGKRPPTARATSRRKPPFRRKPAAGSPAPTEPRPAGSTRSEGVAKPARGPRLERRAGQERREENRRGPRTFRPKAD